MAIDAGYNAYAAPLGFQEAGAREFAGQRIVIFSGGAAETDDKLLEQVRGIHEGGGFGSIIGRNSFTRKKEEALELVGKIMDIYAQN